MNRNDLVLHLMGKKYGFNLREMVRFVFDNQYWSEDQIHHYQSSEFVKLVRHAYEHAPHYRRFMDSIGLIPSDVKRIEDVSMFPILHKEDILKDYNSFLSDNFLSFRPMERSTGGTTGVPFRYYSDASAWGLNQATKIRTYTWGNYTLGKDRIVMMKGGSLNHKGRFGLRTKLWRYLQLNYDIYIMQLSDKDLDIHFRNIRREKIRYLRGYPSALFVIARYLHKKGIQYQMKGIFTTAEMLHGYQRELIESVFMCKIIDAYGCGEGKASANQCEVHGMYHTNIETCYFEILDSNGNKTQPGEQGEIVLTSLCSLCMPFIRYAPGDLAVNGSGKCSCGRGLPTIDRVIGRSSDLIELPNGRFINGLSMPFEALSDIIEKFQLVQEEEDLLVLNIITKSSYSEKDEARIIDLLKFNAGDGIRVKINRVDDIPHTVAGKFRYVISRVKK